MYHVHSMFYNVHQRLDTHITDQFGFSDKTNIQANSNTPD